MSKYEQLAEHLKTGKWIDPMKALRDFGISPSCYHRRLTDFKRANTDYVLEYEWVHTQKSKYKKHKAVLKQAA